MKFVINGIFWIVIFYIFFGLLFSHILPKIFKIYVKFKKKRRDIDIDLAIQDKIDEKIYKNRN